MKSKAGKGKPLGAKQTGGKKPIVNAGVRREVHVPECMVWPDPSAPPAQPDHQQTERMVLPKAQLGKPVDRGYTLPKENANPNVECYAERDTAAEAMRGWPRPAHTEEQHDDFEDFMRGLGVPGGSQGQPYTDYNNGEVGNNSSKKKGKKEKKKKGAENDAHIADLVSHRFLYEAAMERQRKEEEKQRAEEEANRASRSRRFPKDIKANKTSQLRSIALAEKVERSPSDLWQISKFKDNAKTALDTRRQKSGSGGGMAGGAQRGGGENFPTCTCAEEAAPSGYKNGANDRYLQHSPADFDDTKGAEHQVPMSPEKQGEGESAGIVAL